MGDPVDRGYRTLLCRLFLDFCILVGFVKLFKFAAKKYASLSFDGSYQEKSQETDISSYA